MISTTLRKKLNKEMKAILEKNGFHKETRDTWFDHDAQVNYIISNEDLDYKTWRYIQTPLHVILKWCCVTIIHSLEQNDVYYKQVKKSFRKKAKIEKQIEKMLEKYR